MKGGALTNFIDLHSTSSFASLASCYLMLLQDLQSNNCWSGLYAQGAEWVARGAFVMFREYQLVSMLSTSVHIVVTAIAIFMSAPAQVNCLSLLSIVVKCCPSSLSLSLMPLLLGPWANHRSSEEDPFDFSVHMLFDLYSRILDSKSSISQMEWLLRCIVQLR